MIKESKYIIRKIIIGVGIALCLAFLNGCKVKASSNIEQMQLIITDRSNNNLNIYYDNALNEIAFVRSDNILGTVSLNDYPYFYCNNSNSGQFICVFTQDTLTLKYNNSYSYLFIAPNSPYSYYSVSFNNYTYTANITSNEYGEFWVNTDDLIYYHYNYDIYQYNSNILLYEKNVNIGTTSTPEFVSFNALKTVHNNLLLGYTFAPEFSVFDSENYEYQYRIGLNDIFLTMNENLYEFNVNANTTVYVRIKDKSNNEIIDSSTFTITGVGTFVDSNVDYDIKFNGKYRTRNYLNNNSSGSSIIQEYEIDVTFVPESSILKYQYQYVLNGNSIDNNGWIDVTLQTSNMGNFTTVVSQNGTLYARILDSSDNIMSTGSFTINSIGKIAFDNSDDKILNKYNNVLNSINFGGPISGLIDIPIKLIGTISTGLSGGLTCSDYQLGKLMGTNLKIPCVNVKSHLGESLYFTIDVIISACMAYHIIKMLFDFYNNLLFMEKHPIEDLGRRR